MLTRRRFTVRPTILILAAALLLAAAGLAAAGYRARHSRGGPAQAETGAVAGRADAQATRLEVERVTLRRTGFEPAIITRPKGPFVLAIDNVSELEQLDVRLLRETGNQLKALPVSKQRVRWREGIDLHPGTYVLVEANHPEWACRIVVTPR
jgi:hypothetical protein